MKPAGPPERPSRMAGPRRSEDPARPLRAADEADADRLARLLHRPRRKDDAHDRPSGGGDQPPPQQSLPGDAVLAGLGLQPLEAAIPAAETPGSDRAANLSRLVDQVASRILVGNGPTASVQATIRTEILGADAGVEITRTAEGLQVRIDAADAQAGSLLRDHGSDLAATLAARLGERVVVHVPAAAASDGAGQGGDGRQRSRGYEAMLAYAAG